MWNLYKYDERTGNFSPVFGTDGRRVRFASRGDALAAADTIIGQTRVFFETLRKPRTRIAAPAIVRIAAR